MFETLLLHIMVAADTIWTQKKKKNVTWPKTKVLGSNLLKLRLSTPVSTEMLRLIFYP